MPDLPIDAAQRLHLASPAALAHKLTGGKFLREIPHLEYINERLVDVVVRPHGRLMVHAPPRHGKSVLGTQWLTTWILALRPMWMVGIITHSFEFSREWGRAVRNTINENWPELGIAVSLDSKAAYRWNTRQGGGCICIGRGGTLIGRGVQILIVDDPVKDGKESLSETVQAETWETYRSSAVTRLEPDASIFLYQQRWHPDDLSGKLLRAQKDGPEAEGYDEWEVISLPARAKEGDPLGRAVGEPLWPERYPDASLTRIERALGRYWWQAQYDQEPASPGGDLIKEVWWRYWVPAGMSQHFGPVVVAGIQATVVELPEDMTETFQSWDMNFRDSIRAIEEGEEPDPVAGHVWSYREADMFLLDRFHGAVGLNETIHALREMSQAWPQAKTKVVEYAANGPAVIAKLRSEVGGFRPVTPKGSKTSRVLGTPGSGKNVQDRDARAVSLAASVEGGNCYIPHPGLRPWARDFRHRMGLFPQKAGRDDADAASQAWGYAMRPIWQKIEEAHREALDRGGPPPKDAKEAFRRRIWASIEAERRPDDANPYRR